MTDDPIVPDLSVDLAPNNPRELRLSNPVIAASGCFGYGQEYATIIDVQRLGAFVSKGITPRPRSGNPMPRIAETPPGILNISAEAVEDYAMMAAILDEQPGIAAIEVNVSCPNIARGGYCFGWDAGMSAEVTRAVRAVTTL